MGDASPPSTATTVNTSSATNEKSSSHIGDAYEVPAYEAHSSYSVLKDRIKLHYDLASDHYYSLWGQHIHHGYFTSPSDTKEIAQVKLIELLLKISNLPQDSTVLDVGCGIGGTSRYLARERGCTVTGITISTRQVEMAKRLSKSESSQSDEKSTMNTSESSTDYIPIGNGNGKVRFLELDAEKMGTYFSSSSSAPTSSDTTTTTSTTVTTPSSFSAVWISEALSHFPDKPLFFRNAYSVLKSGGDGKEGLLVIADWFKAEDVTPAQMEADIKPIEDGMLLPPLNSQAEYVQLAEAAGFQVLSPPKDISKEVSKTWDISWSLIQNPSLWAFAISQGRDGLAFLQAFRAMRRGYANGSFRYGVMAFRKS